jgi:DNA-binding response OmpR family regulator
MVMIIDEAAADAKTLKKLQAIKNDKMIVLWLGAEREENEGMSITEVFTKPLRLGHLLARLRFYIEVAPKLRSAPMAIGPYQFSAQQRSLVNGDSTIRLTEKETGLLEYLAQSGNPVGREELLASVWGYDARIDTHTLETHIYQLRRKIGNELIMNEGGLYRLAK